MKKYSDFTKELNEGNRDEFNYRMLGRLESDCKYFLGAGNGSERNLWAGNVKDQIKEMKKIFNAISDEHKPEWISLKDIEKYEKEMLKKLKV